MNLKKKDLKHSHREVPMIAPKKMSRKQKKKLSKSLWETTQNIIEQDSDDEYLDSDDEINEE